MKSTIKEIIVLTSPIWICTFLIFAPDMARAVKKQVQKVRLDCPGDYHTALQGKFTAHITQNGDVECVATSEKDCSISTNCKRFGACTYVPINDDYGVCELKKSQDCRRSRVCREEGLCHLEDDFYLRRIGGRWKSFYKTPYPRPDSSVPKWERRSRDCRPHSDADCRKTWECKNWGNCSYLNTGLCHAGHDQGCAASKACTEQGLCKAVDGPWSTTGIEFINGRFRGVCVPVSDEMCRKSDHCRISGECSAGKRSCFADLDSDCQASEVCAKEEKCFVDRTFGFGVCSSKEEIRD